MIWAIAGPVYERQPITRRGIAGGIAEAFYGGVPEAIADYARTCLLLDLFEILDAFRERFPTVPR